MVRLDPLACLTGRENSELGHTMTWKVDARFRKFPRASFRPPPSYDGVAEFSFFLSVFTNLVYAFIEEARRSIPAVFLDHVS